MSKLGRAPPTRLCAKESFKECNDRSINRGGYRVSIKGCSPVLDCHRNSGWHGWGTLGQTRLRKRGTLGKIFPDEGRFWLCKLPKPISLLALAQPQGSPTARPGLGSAWRARAAMALARGGLRAPEGRRALVCRPVPQAGPKLAGGDLNRLARGQTSAVTIYVASNQRET